MNKRMTGALLVAAIAVALFLSTAVLREDADREDLSACKLPNGLSSIPTGVDVRDFAKAFAKAAAAHTENRKKLVELGISLISSKDANLANRHLAAILLGQLRAVEAAPALAAHVDDNLATKSGEITVDNYRCVQALIDIGLPGAVAALKQIEIDFGSEAPKGSDVRFWNDRVGQRRNLLALVVLKVYGEKMGKIVMNDKIAQAKEPKVKTAYQEALEAFPRIRNWLPDDMAPTTSPILAAPRPATGPRSEEPSKMPFQIDQLDVRDFRTATFSHMENNKKLVEMSIDLLLSKDATTINRYLACEFLGNIRASEGAAVLTQIIDIPLSGRLVNSRITIRYSYGCLYSLIKIGQSGAKAAVVQIETDTKIDKPEAELASLWKDRLKLRRNMLTLVVLKVYGEKLGKIVMEEKIAQAKDPKVKAALQEAIEAFPRIRNWLPDDKELTTSPISTRPAR